MRVLSRGHAEVLGYKFSSRLFLVVVLQTNALIERDNQNQPNTDMRNKKLTLFVQREQSVDDLLKGFDGPRPIA